MIFDPATLERRELNSLVTGLVLPRPIALVSTVSASGERNLTPFSFFNAFSFHPPVLAIGPGGRQGTPKDTTRNIRETGEFVVCVVTEGIAERANLTSGEVGPEVDEWEMAGFTPLPCEVVRPCRVAESPAAFECTLLEAIDLTHDDVVRNTLIVGRVQRIHVDDDAIDGFVPRREALRIVGRLGETAWTTTRDTFELPRPATADPERLRADAEALDARGGSTLSLGREPA